MARLTVTARAPRRTSVAAGGRLALVLVAATLAQSTPAQAAPATELDSSGVGVSAYAGWAAWTHVGADPREDSLMMRSPTGSVSSAPVPPSNGPFDVELGPGVAGVEAVFQRCTKPTRDLGCSIYELSLTTPGATEQKLVIPGGGSDFLPAIWRRRLAFVRSNPRGGEPRPDDLYVESIGGGAPRALALPVSRGARHSQGGPWPSGLTGVITALTISSLHVAYVTSNDVGSFGETTLWYEPIGGRPGLIDQQTGGAGNVCPPAFLSPVISGGWLYAYLHACDPSADPRFDRLTRYRGRQAQRAKYTFVHSGDDQLTSVVPDGSGVDWDDDGVRRLSRVGWQQIKPPIPETFCTRLDPFC